VWSRRSGELVRGRFCILSPLLQVPQSGWPDGGRIVSPTPRSRVAHERGQGLGARVRTGSDTSPTGESLCPFPLLHPFASAAGATVRLAGRRTDCELLPKVVAHNSSTAA
jgi:hypothetical protein